MNNKTAISIIMPCLNSVKHIAEAVDSVLAQSFTGFELIAVDGGSTDGTLDILTSYAAGDARVQVLHSEKKSMGAQFASLVMAYQLLENSLSHLKQLPLDFV